MTEGQLKDLGRIGGVMANNRMFLVNNRTGQKVMLAKYYPSTGWYVQNEKIKESLDDAFNIADFGVEDWPNTVPPKPDGKIAVGGMWGGNEWQIEYEIAK